MPGSGLKGRRSAAGISQTSLQTCIIVTMSSNKLQTLSETGFVGWERTFDAKTISECKNNRVEAVFALNIRTDTSKLVISTSLVATWVWVNLE